MGKPMSTDNLKKLTFVTKETDWLPVNEYFYYENIDNLNMVLYHKSSEGIERLPQPDGYQFVGNEDYGSWEEDDNGIPIWVFVVGYYLLSSDTVSRNEFNQYKQAKLNGKSYYGKKNGKSKYGTTGSKNKNTPFAKKMVCGLLVGGGL